MTAVQVGRRAESVRTVPEGMSATEPPEARGLRRDEVRLLVAGHGAIRHSLFGRLGEFLQPGDLVVVNTSATVPAALDGLRGDGSPVRIHYNGPAAGGGAIIELRRPGHGTVGDAVTGEHLTLPDGAQVELHGPFPDGGPPRGSRLWRTDLRPAGGLEPYLHRFGRPVTYDYVRGQWPLASYQTIFAREAGSAEMPSAGRPFSPAVVTDLVARGVTLAPITLHTGVSSPEAGEPPLPERFDVPAVTARLINTTRSAGNHVIAVGTTVTRAIETVADGHARVTPGAGWTELVLGPARPARVVDGLVTGWHEPAASHVQLLEAVAGRDLVDAAYAAAVAERYRWHEFGDSCLLLPPPG